jgi:hypothetical protein
MMTSAIRRWAVGPALVLGLVGCEVLGILPVDAKCDSGQPTTLQVTSPLGGTSLPAGSDVSVTVAYQAGNWAYDTLEVFAGSTLIGAELLTSASFSGSFPWPTTGLVPGPVALKVVAVDRVSTKPCHDRASPEVTVQIAAAAPTIVRQPSDASTSEGGTATFDVGVRGSGPLTYRWQRSDDGGATFDDILDDAASLAAYQLGDVTVAEHDARFRARITNHVGDVVSDPARLEVCPRPPLLEFDRSAPSPATPPAVTYWSNLLVDPGFESPVRVGLAPSDFGYWRFDESVSAPAQQGVAPRGGTRMLQFVGSSRDLALSNGGASEQAQLVDVSALRDDIDAELVEVRAAAHFARVAGCSTTDDVFFVIVVAFDGAPATFGTRWTNGINAAIAQGVPRDDADMTGVDGWLLHRQTRIRHVEPEDRVGDVFDWRRVEVTADLPAGTTFVALVLAALENVANEAAFPEFHGNYADDAELTLWLRP